MNTVFIESINMFPGETLWNKFNNVLSNTGNLVFNEYCKKGIDYSSVYKLNTDWNYVNSDSVYVLPLSNNLSVEDTLFTRLLYRLAKFGINVVPVGVGIQTDLNDTPREYVNRLPGRKKRLFQTLAYNTNSIGVRGPFTAECMELIGIRNVRVIGCPSYYSKFLNNRTESTTENNIESNRVCINLDMNSANYSIKTYGKTLKQVYQTLPEYINYRIKTDLNNNSSIFFSIDEWSKWIKENAFLYAIGDRFHGNMICYLNNVKTIWIEKDRRIAELCDTLGLPMYRRNGNKSYLLEDIVCNLDVSNKKNEELLLKEYLIFLNENNISHKFLQETSK